MLPAHQRKWGIIPIPKSGGHIPDPPAPTPMGKKEREVSLCTEFELDSFACSKGLQGVPKFEDGVTY